MKSRIQRQKTKELISPLAANHGVTLGTSASLASDRLGFDERLTPLTACLPFPFRGLCQQKWEASHFRDKGDRLGTGRELQPGALSSHLSPAARKTGQEDLWEENGCPALSRPVK